MVGCSLDLKPTATLAGLLCGRECCLCPRNRGFWLACQTRIHATSQAAPNAGTARWLRKHSLKLRQPKHRWFCLLLLRNGAGIPHSTSRVTARGFKPSFIQFKLKFLTLVGSCWLFFRYSVRGSESFERSMYQ